MAARRQKFKKWIPPKSEFSAQQAPPLSLLLSSRLFPEPSEYKSVNIPRSMEIEQNAINKVYVLVTSERDNLYVVEGDIALAFTNLRDASNYIKNEEKENPYLPQLSIVSIWITDIGKSKVNVKFLQVYVILGQRTNRIYGDCYYLKENADYKSMEINLTRKEGEEETYVRGLVVV
jgi:hypothetical protein